MGASEGPGIELGSGGLANNCLRLQQALCVLAVVLRTLACVPAVVALSVVRSRCRAYLWSVDQEGRPRSGLDSWAFCLFQQLPCVLAIVPRVLRRMACEPSGRFCYKGRRPKIPTTLRDTLVYVVSERALIQIEVVCNIE